ncbi:MAG: sarcinarray family MAST domain-containing protein [Candidatus Thermoplasmatota archaeon]|nr:sarcinarray family MAST domain-containing protein [Candidatus Thermoplasmatota archaeon]
MFLLVMLLICLFLSTVNAAENDFGIVHAWIKFEDGEWQTAGIDGVTLKVHEPFKLKVTVDAKVECDVYVVIGGPGNTKTYETVEGPSKCGTAQIPEYVEDLDCPVGWNRTFEWTVCPTGNWTQGTAPLNLHVFFITMGEDKKIALGLINAYISPEIWEGTVHGINGDSDSTTSQNTPGFEGVFLSALFAVMVMLKRKQHN